MTWTRLDDGFHSNPKILQLDDTAFRLYVTALNWSTAQLTDGHVARVAIDLCLTSASVRAKNLAVKSLEVARMWTPCGQHSRCWIIKDFADYQFTRSQVEDYRAANRQRQQRFRDARRQKQSGPSNGVTVGVTTDVTNGARNGVTNGLITEPNPTQPNPTLSLRESDVSDNDSQLADTAILTAFAKAQGLKGSTAWLRRHRHSAAELRDLVDQVVEVDRLVNEFVPWAIEQGCRVPAGLQAFVGTWLAAEPATVDIDDCDLCDNRRLLGQRDDGTDTTVDDPAASSTVQCVCLTQRRHLRAVE